MNFPNLTNTRSMENETKQLFFLFLFRPHFWSFHKFLKNCFEFALKNIVHQMVIHNNNKSLSTDTYIDSLLNKLIFTCSYDMSSSSDESSSLANAPSNGYDSASNLEWRIQKQTIEFPSYLSKSGRFVFFPGKKKITCTKLHILKRYFYFSEQKLDAYHAQAHSK